MAIVEKSCASQRNVDRHCEQKSEAASGDDARSLQDSLYALKVECPVKVSIGCNKQCNLFLHSPVLRYKRKQVIQGKLFIRISAWVYNEPNDYVRLAKVSIDYSVRQTHRINHIGIVLCVKFSEPDRQSNKHVPHLSLIHI